MEELGQWQMGWPSKVEERERYSVRLRYDRIQPFVLPWWDPGWCQYLIGE
jgi:hypothetical protein